MPSPTRFFKILTIGFSTFFAIALFLSIYQDQGVGRSLLFVSIVIAFIWFPYFMWGSLFRKTYEEGIEEGRRREQIGGE